MHGESGWAARRRVCTAAFRCTRAARVLRKKVCARVAGGWWAACLHAMLVWSTRGRAAGGLFTNTPAKKTWSSSCSRTPLPRSQRTLRAAATREIHTNLSSVPSCTRMSALELHVRQLTPMYTSCDTEGLTPPRIEDGDMKISVSLGVLAVLGGVVATVPPPSPLPLPPPPPPSMPAAAPMLARAWSQTAHARTRMPVRCAARTRLPTHATPRAGGGGTGRTGQPATGLFGPATGSPCSLTLRASNVRHVRSCS